MTSLLGFASFAPKAAELPHPPVLPPLLKYVLGCDRPWYACTKGVLLRASSSRMASGSITCPSW